MMRRGALPIEDWPEFAKTPWRQPDGTLVISYTQRRTLGSYFDTLRQRGLSLETIDRATILEHLQRIEREHATIGAVYAYITYWVRVLARVYPYEDWRWLHDWRLDWRCSVWPIETRGRRNSQLPFRPEASCRWPRQLRATWKRNWPTLWSAARDRAYRPTYGLFRAYCVHTGIAPNPTRETVEAFADVLERHEPQRTPAELWNLYHALMVLFPATDWVWMLSLKREIESHTRPRHPRHPPRGEPKLSIPFRSWPAEDQEAWQRGISQHTPDSSRLDRYRQRCATRKGAERVRLSPHRSRRPIRPPHRWSSATIKDAERAYSAYLKMVQDLGLNDRMATESSVAKWVEAMRQRNAAPLTLVSYLNSLHAAMRILHPQQDWRWLQQDARVLGDEAKPVRDKLSRIADVADLRKAAIRRMRRVGETPPTVQSALVFQDGLIMLLLSYRPVRRRNLTETRLGINLVFDDEFKTGQLCYEHTKSGARYDAPLPQSVLHWLRRFLTTYRPVLAGPNITNEAWLSSNGHALSGDMLCHRVGEATRQELGIRITPHLFRDCFATTVSEIAPENIEDAARLLGHNWPVPHQRKRPAEPAIEIYRQRAGTTATAERLSELQQRYRVRPRPRLRS